MYQTMMVKAGILDLLLSQIASDAPTRVQLKAIEALLYFDGILSLQPSLTNEEDFQKTMLKKGILKSLLSLLNHKDTQLQSKSLEMIQFFDGIMSLCHLKTFSPLSE